ncbi:MAG: hypothetical protein KGI59_00135, partial [Patescibacteria group bacterium]|nr:hypothetical protein [Patescibacteria group bacterium]
GIDYVHSLGMHAMVKVHLESEDGQSWRAYINASNRDAWYANYGSILDHLGDIGKVHHLEGITMGAELISMAAYTQNSDNTERWQKMIADLRTHFPGYLTYDANWSWAGPQSTQFEDEVFHIGFWSSLDYVGLSAYYPLASGQNAPSVAAMVGSWAYWDSNQISIIHSEFNKPLLFTEVGYRSVTGAHNSPCCTGPGPYDAQEQANDYEALFEYWNNSSYMAGVDLWDWNVDPNYGGPGNTDYTANNKPALAVVTRWFGGGGSTGGTTGQGTGGTGGIGGGSNTTPSMVSGNFNVSATASAYSVGQSQNIQINLNSTGQASNVIADIEIYNSSNTKIFQQFFGGQNISSGSPGSYKLSWTPPQAGAYRLKVGVFSSDWSKNFFWDDDVTDVTLNGTADGAGGQNSGGSTGSAGPVVMDVWWPADGAAVSGIQPFKGLIEGTAATAYSMYWQVDGGQLNVMADNTATVPHKESLVDVSPWSWWGGNGDGPYAVTFIAKDASGNVIARKSVDITVAH